MKLKEFLNAFEGNQNEIKVVWVNYEGKPCNGWIKNHVYMWQIKNKYLLKSEVVHWNIKYKCNGLELHIYIK